MDIEGSFVLRGGWDSWGDMFILRGTEISFPRQFKAVPVITMTLISCSGELSSVIPMSSFYQPTASAFAPALFRATKGNDNVDYRIAIFAHGRWK